MLRQACEGECAESPVILLWGLSYLLVELREVRLGSILDRHDECGFGGWLGGCWYNAFRARGRGMEWAGDVAFSWKDGGEGLL